MEAIDVEKAYGPGIHQLLKAAVVLEEGLDSHDADPGVEGEDSDNDEGPTSSSPADPKITTQNLPGGTSSNIAPQSRANRQRKRKREAQILKHGYRPSPIGLMRHVRTAATVKTNLDAKNLPATSCGYAATNHTPPKPALPAAIQALVEQGYEVVKNDGKTCKAFVGPDGRIFAVAAGQPCDPTYQEDHDNVCRTFLDVGARLSYRDSELNHKRGDFPAVNIGVTHSRGTKRPVFLKSDHQEAIDDLLEMKELQRMAKFANAAFATWAPDLYSYYKRYTDDLFEKMPKLRRIFGGKSVFPCAAFNFGPRVCTVSHRDQLNLSFGWCSIQALGWFDHELGGHLVLDDIKKIVEFPAGSLMLIPSATLTHRNLPVRHHEVRMSFTQFCSGGIFRFVDNGFRTQNELKEQNPQAYQEIMEKKKSRWNLGLSLWSKLADVVELAAV